MFAFHDTPSKPKRTVLVVEDDPINQQTCQLMLERVGLVVHVVGDGKTALMELKQRQYDIVLMDINLPVMNGIDTAISIKADRAKKSLPTIPIIAVTAYTGDYDLESMLQTGFDAYVSKPIDYKQLLSEVGRLLEIDYSF